jgi:hypothetical protein
MKTYEHVTGLQRMSEGCNSRHTGTKNIQARTRLTPQLSLLCVYVHTHTRTHTHTLQRDIPRKDVYFRSCDRASLMYSPKYNQQDATLFIIL